MTVGLGDAVILTELFGGDVEKPIDLHSGLEEERIRQAAEHWFWKRKNLSGTVNVLAQALYSLFGADGEYTLCCCDVRHSFRTCRR